ncbi:putative VIER F-box protein 2 [Lobosporangium transversale]|uniref:F-box domain-containing protein n=1 Tax=Lobosporangium transversale TaxID=64571 RepID=A0A1Y2H371_9FUNG|nr:hypothetical protein BCR41DRAFT_344379 [Lobosporangium transversale]KAF9918084.1 putative VIER F-box protein 2 [Lobosporangium transversale]ORZ28985.1 hypothetical protein BCR41DRAFT_344379 [Lobosporangium transversale]|eukprot:XP_021886658.1 hypothetical protein BCR41DRAFT_344379 [Lobosporangium transversale]
MESTSPLQVPELLANVLHFLDKNSLLLCSMVSTEWSKICTPLLWESCSFSAEQYSLFHQVFDQHAFLIRNMEAKHRLIGGEMRFVAQQCTNLSTLTLRYCQVTPSSLDVLCNGIARVRHLVFDHCMGVNSTSVGARLPKLPSLSSLEIAVHAQDRGSGDWRENDMVILLTGCRCLKSLKVDGPDLSHVHLLGIKRHEEPLPIKHLHLVSTFISEPALKNILRQCPELSTLVLLHNANKNATVHAIAETCPNLKMLELRNSKSVTASTFGSIFKKCPLLTKLDVSYTLINDVGALALAQNCPQLRALDLTGCSRITHTASKELLARLSRLQELKAGGCPKLKIEGFSSEEEWASRDSLEILEIPHVGIRPGVDDLTSLLRHLSSLRRLRRLCVDEGVGQDNVLQAFIAQRSDVSLIILEPLERPT